MGSGTAGKIWTVLAAFAAGRRGGFDAPLPFDHLGNFGSRSGTGRNMSPKLGIIVPYRERAPIILMNFCSKRRVFFAAGAKKAKESLR